LPPIEEFEQKHTSKTKAFNLLTQVNPTGYFLYSKERVEALEDIVKNTILFLFADEVYREFVMTTTPPLF